MRTAEQYEICLRALEAYARDAGFTDAVIGLSGGIDSSLVATMSVEAFGADRVHGVLLPGPYSSDHSVDDARALVENLGIEPTVISIVEPYEAFSHVLAEACGGSFEGLASENTQARCRMVCLMALSNAHGWMLVNTGNKSEASMGYSTLYGDTAGAYAPIGGLYKTDVFAMARWLNERAASRGEVPPIPEHVLVKAPSAELSPGQEDEKSLGVDYASLDRVLATHIERGAGVEELVECGFERELAERIVKTVSSYAYKRTTEPPFPAVPPSFL